MCSLLLGLPFLTLHFGLGMLFKENILTDRSWLLSLMISYTFLLLVWNTKTLRTLTLNLFDLAESESEQFHSTIIKQLEGILSNHRLFCYGTFFGLLNVSFGVVYGIWYANPYLVASIVLQFFVEGFICGMAVCGIVGIVKMIYTFSAQEEITINYRAPDKCGGFSKIGNTLLQFSITSLSVGVLISLYIYLSPWTHEGQAIVKYSIYIWMVFPHFVAISVLFFPLLTLHNMLEKFKSHHDLLLTRRCASIQNYLGNLLHESDVKDFHHLTLGVIYYNHMTEMHSKLHSLCTWPFDSRSGSIYVAGFLVATLVPVSQLVQLIQAYKTFLQ